jgi:multimeric flavodoxin WrbA
VRVVDYDVKPGVELDMGDGDAWPAIRAQLIDADIVILSTPTWMGQQSSVRQRVLERLDAELSETGDNGQPSVAGKVAIAAVVGNEDGAHHISGCCGPAATPRSGSPARGARTRPGPGR